MWGERHAEKVDREAKDASIGRVEDEASTIIAQRIPPSARPIIVIS